MKSLLFFANYYEIKALENEICCIYCYMYAVFLQCFFLIIHNVLNSQQFMRSLLFELLNLSGCSLNSTNRMLLFLLIEYVFLLVSVF